jgi:hypothetical protein
MNQNTGRGDIFLHTYEITKIRIISQATAEAQTKETVNKNVVKFFPTKMQFDLINNVH